MTSDTLGDFLFEWVTFLPMTLFERIRSKRFKKLCVVPFFIFVQFTWMVVAAVPSLLTLLVVCMLALIEEYDH